MIRQSAHWHPDKQPQSRQQAELCVETFEPAEEGALARSWPEYLPVREAARFLGVSERSVYGYVENGRLPCTHQGNLLVIETAAVRSFQRRASGRPRAHQPEWHRSSFDNAQVLTHISVMVRAGQRQALEQRLEQFHQNNRHHLPGTVARSIAFEPVQPLRVKLVFIWRKAAMPSQEEVLAALKTLRDDLSELVDWECSVLQECEIALHT